MESKNLISISAIDSPLKRLTESICASRDNCWAKDELSESIIINEVIHKGIPIGRIPDSIWQKHPEWLKSSKLIKDWLLSEEGKPYRNDNIYRPSGEHYGE